MAKRVIVRHTVTPKTSNPVRTVSFKTTYKINNDGTISATKTRTVKNNV